MTNLKLQETPVPWNQIAETAARYFTPEEKSAFAAFLTRQRGAATGDVAAAYIALAQSAGLFDLEARWRYEFLLANAGQPAAQMHLERLTELERQRLKFSELGGWLAAYWKAIPPDQKERDALLGQAADAYRSAGDRTSELQMLALLAQNSGIEGERMDRYLALTNAQGLVALANPGGSDEKLGNAAVAAAIARDNARSALDTVAARGKSLPPVWTKVYTALTGLYYANASQPVQAAFSDALGMGTIGERIGKPADRTQQLAGDVWFYYGSRYGEYLAAIRQNGAEDYLPATLEATPGRSDAYFELAEYYLDAGNRTRALDEYRNALQLEPDHGAAHARVARLLWRDGKKDDAIAEWRTALESFGRLQDRGRAPQEFWRDVQETLTDIGQSGTLPTLRADADKLLRTYVRRNGSYQVDALLEGAIAAAGNPQTGVAWVVDLAGSAGDPSNVLGYLLGATWIPDEQRGVVHQRLVELGRTSLAQSFGDARTEAQSRLENRQLAWVQYLLDRKDLAQARAVFSQIGAEARGRHAYEYISLEARIAARAGTLGALVDGWTRDPGNAPTAEILRQTATGLAGEGDSASSWRILEFVYRRELDQQRLDAANFLGLSEILLQRKDLAGALALLRRMTLVSAEPFDSLAPGAALLQRTGHSAEAVEFLTARVKAVPWDWDARRLLGSARQSKDDLTGVASARDAAYEVRAQAALDLRTLGGAPMDAGSAELNLLGGSGPIPETAAAAPLFYRARVTAAASADAAGRIRLLSDAISLDPSAPATRLSLFQAAVAARRYALAVSVYQYAPPPDPAADVQRSLGEAYERLGLPAEAERNYNMADNSETRIAQRAAIRAALKSVREQIRLQALNAARRPAVSNKLEQDHPVRPRLLKLPNVAQAATLQLAGRVGQ
jgi:tetratricopeptide (TPR) repeat protein